ncbi:hypothetical protein [Helicobacter burdigaliensis]|uniref:hypothetical protein n=1 Tax=Helicobacter burdigaliensis TaxID=2315334 RepID=UPI000EF72243|nr:hypothetical protein [Helicobacter burdigaliensis]
MLPEHKEFKVVKLLHEFEFFAQKSFTAMDFSHLGFNVELIHGVMMEVQSAKGDMQNMRVISCPSYIREKFDEMDREYYGRIINIFKNFSVLLENKKVLSYIDKLLNVDKAYHDLDEKDQKLLYSLYASHHLYHFMRELLVMNGAITRMMKRLCRAMEEFYPSFKKQFERFHN